MPSPDEELDWATQKVVSQWAYAYDRFEKVFKYQLTATLNAADPRDLNGAVRRSAALAKQMEALRESVFEVAGSTSRDVVSRLPQVVARAENLELKQMIAQLPPHQFAQVDEALRTGQNLVGQDVTLLRSDPRSIAAIIRRTTEQITAKNYLLSSSATIRMKQALMRAIPEGMNPKEASRLMLKNVRGEFNGGVARALTIARTEMIDAHRSAATESRRANLDVLAGWQWHADLSDRTCRACLSMHGRAFPAEQSGPDGHPNCRCTAIPITKTWEELGIKGAQETRVVVDHREAYKWFNRQSMSVKRRILTQKGLDAWYKDQWNIQDWAQERTNVGWRKSWNAGVPGVSSGVSYPTTYSTKLLTQGNTKTRVKKVPPPKVDAPVPPKVKTPAKTGAQTKIVSKNAADAWELSRDPKRRMREAIQAGLADSKTTKWVRPDFTKATGSTDRVWLVDWTGVSATAKTAYSNAFKSLGKLHRSPGRVAIVFNQTTANLQNRSFAQGSVSINMNGKAAQTANPFTFSHEYGHHLDYSLMHSLNASKATSKSKVTPAYDTQTASSVTFEAISSGVNPADLSMGAWHTAITQSKAYKEIQRKARLKADIYPGTSNADYGSYLLTPTELWARSYSQWVARRIGDDSFLKGLHEYQGSDWYNKWNVQWDDEDFEPILRAIDELMKPLMEG